MLPSFNSPKSRHATECDDKPLPSFPRSCLLQTHRPAMLQQRCGGKQGRLWKLPSCEGEPRAPPHAELQIAKHATVPRHVTGTHNIHISQLHRGASTCGASFMTVTWPPRVSEICAAHSRPVCRFKVCLLACPLHSYGGEFSAQTIAALLGTTAARTFVRSLLWGLSCAACLPLGIGSILLSANYVRAKISAQSACRCARIYATACSDVRAMGFVYSSGRETNGTPQAMEK